MDIGGLQLKPFPRGSKRTGVAFLVVAGTATKHPYRPWHRKSLFLQPGDGFRSQQPACRAPVDADVLWLVLLQEFAIDGSNILACRWKSVLGRHSIVDANDFDPAYRADGNRFELADRPRPHLEVASV